MGKPKRLKRKRLHNGERLTVYLLERPGLAYRKVTAHDVQAALPTESKPEVEVPMVLVGLDHLGVLTENEPDRVRQHELVLGWLLFKYRPRRT